MSKVKKGVPVRLNYQLDVIASAELYNSAEMVGELNSKIRDFVITLDGIEAFNNETSFLILLGNDK